MDIRACFHAFGGDFEELYGRIPNENLIRKLLLRFPEDPSWQDIGQALEEDRREAAFRSAHNLKGLCLNLSFTQLYRSSSALTEALRPGSDADDQHIRQLYEVLTRDYRNILTTIEAFKE